MPFAAPAQSSATLPEPLTLEFALSLADEGHPDLVHREADLARSQASLDAADARPGFSASLIARGRFVDTQSSVSYQKHDDHALRISVRKPLWDFGRSDAAMKAAQGAVVRDRWRLADARHARRMDILRAYFDVLLADLEYAYENEAMAIAFVTLNRARERNALGQVSDIDLFERESVYQQARRTRYAADARQRSSRAQLANVLNRPGELSSRLIAPTLAVLDRAAPDHVALESEALENNASIKAARAGIEAARQSVAEARAGDGPLLSAQFDTGIGSRPANANDTLRAAVVLEVPLTSGGRLEAEVAKREADVTAANARLREAELRVRQAVLESWLALETLAAERASARTFADYRDLYLDRSRALYEHEVRADLGDAMVQISESILRSARVDFELALTWARIHGLAGRAPETLDEWILGAGE